MSPTARQRASRVRALIRLRCALSLAKAISMGLRSGAVGREEQEPGAAFFEDRPSFSLLWEARLSRMTTSPGRIVGASWVSTQVSKIFRFHRAVDEPRRGEAVASQSSDEGLRGPVAERRARLHPLAAAGTAAKLRHLGGRAGLIDEHQTVGLLGHPRLAVLPPFLPASATSARSASLASSVFLKL